MGSKNQLNIFTSIFKFFHPSGGFFYHLKARKNKKNWLNYIQNLDEIFKENYAHELKHKTLIVVGVSGAYCLKSSFFDEFKEIHLIDWDFSAAFFFKKNHPHVKVTFHRMDFFKQLKKLNHDLVSLFHKDLKIVDSPSQIFIFFNNILGQIHSEKMNFTLSRLEKSLSVFPFYMSVHDRITSSNPFRPKYTRVKSRERLSDETLLEWYETESPKNQMVWVESSGMIDFFQKSIGPYEYLAWPINHKQFQVVEVVVSRVLQNMTH